MEYRMSSWGNCSKKGSGVEKSRKSPDQIIEIGLSRFIYYKYIKDIKRNMRNKDHII